MKGKLYIASLFLSLPLMAWAQSDVYYIPSKKVKTVVTTTNRPSVSSDSRQYDYDTKEVKAYIDAGNAGLCTREHAVRSLYGFDTIAEVVTQRPMPTTTVRRIPVHNHTMKERWTTTITLNELSVSIAPDLAS